MKVSQSSEDHNVLEWEELTVEDQNRAEALLKELNELFDRNFRTKRDEERQRCADSTSED
jgi:hypothetical protein